MLLGHQIPSGNHSARILANCSWWVRMAMYIAAAKRRFGPKVVPKLRGTVQADIFKEVQAQNETIFPIEPSLRFLTDMAIDSIKNFIRMLRQSPPGAVFNPWWQIDEENDISPHSPAIRDNAAHALGSHRDSAEMTATITERFANDCHSRVAEPFAKIDC